MTTYQIGEKTYTMEKLVMGQIEHLTRRLETMGDFELSVPGVIRLVSKHTNVLACVLLPDGLKRADLVAKLDAEDTKETEAYLRAHLEVEVLVTVVKDFFELIPMSQLLDVLTTMKTKVLKVFNLQETLPSSSKPSMPNSAEDGSGIVPSSEALLHPTTLRHG